MHLLTYIWSDCAETAAGAVTDSVTWFEHIFVALFIETLFSIGWQYAGIAASWHSFDCISFFWFNCTDPLAQFAMDTLLSNCLADARELLLAELQSPSSDTSGFSFCFTHIMHTWNSLGDAGCDKLIIVDIANECCNGCSVFWFLKSFCFSLKW